MLTHPVNVGRQGEHPTEKPVPLMMELVELYSNAGQTISDPFMGSGTCGVACARMGRGFVGIEQNERWFDLACRRIEEAQRQADLFITTPEPVLKQADIFEASA